MVGAVGKNKKKPSSKKAAVPRRVRLTVDDRRAQLIALGLDAFARAPYEAVSVEDIAAQAGISRGLLFHYFPSKRDFYIAVVQVMAAQMLEATFVAEPAGQSPEQLLQLLVQGLDNYFIYIEGHADAFAMLLRAGGETGSEAVVEETRKEFVRRMRSYLPQAVGVDEALLRASLTAWERFVEGIALDWVEHRDLPRSERVQLAVRAAFMFQGAAGMPAVGFSFA
jgi:AcrR family transcriptional regulator